MTISEKDSLYNWHPYTQHKIYSHFPAIVKGKDEFLWDENGKKYIDGFVQSVRFRNDVS
jgi:adenosylmethionine-8-amino-7-oxononanoate aminotransferase